MPTLHADEAAWIAEPQPARIPDATCRANLTALLGLAAAGRPETAVAQLNLLERDVGE
jgi:hypothetical protein